MSVSDDSTRAMVTHAIVLSLATSIEMLIEASEIRVQQAFGKDDEAIIQGKRAVAAAALNAAVQAAIGTDVDLIRRALKGARVAGPVFGADGAVTTFVRTLGLTRLLQEIKAINDIDARGG